MLKSSTGNTGAEGPHAAGVLVGEWISTRLLLPALGGAEREGLGELGVVISGAIAASEWPRCGLLDFGARAGTKG